MIKNEQYLILQFFQPIIQALEISIEYEAQVISKLNMFTKIYVTNLSWRSHWNQMSIYTLNKSRNI